jgi:HlyD family secretion protein
MSKLLKHARKFFLSKTVIAIVIVLIIVGVVIARKNTNTGIAGIQTAVASVGNVVEQVSVTGTVSPINSADLAFEKGGVVETINVAVGDQVKAGDTIASLDSSTDKASLASEQAKLDDLTRSLTPQESAADQAQVNTALTALNNAQQDTVNAVEQSYTEVQSAVTNYADNFFTNPQSSNPTINVYTQTQPIAIAIDNQRLQVATALAQWQTDTTAVSTTSTPAALAILSQTNSYLATIQSFVSNLSGIINDLAPGDSGLTQAAINADVASINSAMSGVNQAVSTISSVQTELTNASASYSGAQSQFALDVAGSSADTIAAQSAEVALAQAQLNQDTITSPIDGIITQVVPNVGEFVPAGQTEFSVQGTGFKIEAYVPEADIAKVAIGDMASDTLNAYGSYVNFPSQVTLIDPSETVLEGVPTYKVTLDFLTPDSRILSGMTANLEILTHEADNVLEIPYRAVIQTATSTTVRVLSADGKTYATVPIVVGLKGSDGTIQVISGLNAGDKVVTYIPS